MGPTEREIKNKAQEGEKAGRCWSPGSSEGEGCIASGFLDEKFICVQIIKSGAL
jgi:hypothetical protein